MAESPEYRCLLTQQGAATKALGLNSQEDKSIEPSNDQYDKNGRRNLIAMTQLIKKVAGDCIKMPPNICAMRLIGSTKAGVRLNSQDSIFRARSLRSDESIVIIELFCCVGCANMQKDTKEQTRNDGLSN